MYDRGQNDVTWGLLIIVVTVIGTLALIWVLS